MYASLDGIPSRRAGITPAPPPRPLLTQPRPFYGTRTGTDHPIRASHRADQVENVVLVACRDQLAKQAILLACISPHSRFEEKENASALALSFSLRRAGTGLAPARRGRALRGSAPYRARARMLGVPAVSPAANREV